MIAMWSLFCEECLKVWSSTHRDRDCIFCGAEDSVRATRNGLD